MPNIVYIATSLDGYIADKNGDLEWLEQIPNPEKSDCGWAAFLDRIDAIIMGRNTFETVCGFQGPWPYPKPVFVLSNTLSSVPNKAKEKAEIINGSVKDVIARLHKRGLNNLYIDGGKTIQSFLNENLIDELIITTIPTLLGGGTPLFGELQRPLNFEYVKTDVLLNAMVKNYYRKPL